MYTKTKMLRVKGPADVPNGHHFAVLIYCKSSVYVLGDQRSREAPGHGYPEHTDHFDIFEHWITEDNEILHAFLREIEEEHKRDFSKKEPYVFFEVAKKGQLQMTTKVLF